jgi:tetratricopeptide (TPR) repeat protein
MRKTDYNPSILSDEEIENLFISRITYFEYLFKKIVSEAPNSIPQHYILIGHRGMGKTTMLYRIAVELRKKPYCDIFIPLSFPEEQRNIDSLSKFWYNCLNALLDALDKEKLFDLAVDLEKEIISLHKSDYLIEGKLFGLFQYWWQKLKKRPVLLVDNLNLVFNKISVAEQHQLRAILMSNDAPIVFGASTIIIDQVVNYGAPFYDAFQIHSLKKISFEESVEVLKNLAKIVIGKEFDQTIFNNRGRLRTLYQLTGGTPRAISMLFPLLNIGFNENIQKDLELILDQVTPLYNARLDELSDQMQIVLNAIAINWEPMSLEEIRNSTNLENAQLSPQLKRLYEIGWLQKNEEMDTKGVGYEISERFFNLWYLMRYSTRRKKEYLFRLSNFLVSYYGAELQSIANNQLNRRNLNINQVSLDLAIAESLKNEPIGQKLYNKAHIELIEFAKSDANVIKNFDIPENKINSEIKKLQSELNLKFESELLNDCYEIILQMLNLDSSNSSIWFNKGLLCAAMQKYTEAEKAFKKAIEIDKKFADPWYYLGNLCQIHLQKYEEAEIAYKKATQIDKKSPDPWNSLGNLFQDRLQRYDEAESAYKKAIDIDEKDASSWNGLGNLYQNHLQKYEEAEKSYKKAIELDEKLAYPWNGLGNLYQNHLQKYEEAEKGYKKAIELDEKLAYPWNGLGNLYQNHLQKYDEAEIAYKKAIELDEKLAYSWNVLGILYQNHLQKYGEAEIAYKKAIELDEKLAYPWYGLGNLYLERLQKYIEAEKSYKKAIELDEKLAYPWNGLGNLYQGHLQKYAEAEKAYKKAIDLDEKFTYPWNGLGNLYQDHFQIYVEAEKSYYKSIELNPDFIYPKYNLVFLLRDKMGKIKDAKKMFDSIKTEKDLMDCHYLNLALFDYYENNLGKAKENIELALAEIKDKLPSNTQDDWWRAAGVVVKLGFGHQFLQVLKENGFEFILKPYYTAIYALISKSHKMVINRVAMEVREPALEIMEKIKKHIPQ